MAHVHVVKLAVGAETLADLAEWQKNQIKSRGAPVCGTRMRPKREEEILAGGSLYWVIKGVIVVRQRIVRIDEVMDFRGERVGLYLDPKLVRTEPHPRRAFQGWRYLDPKDAPADLNKKSAGANLPEEMQRKLRELGAW